MLDTLPPNNTPAPLFKARTAYSNKWVKSHTYLHLNEGFVLLAAPDHSEMINCKGNEEDVVQIASADEKAVFTFANEYTICTYINRNDVEGTEIFTNDLVFVKRKSTLEEYHGVVVFDPAVSAYCVRVDTEGEPRYFHLEENDEILVSGNIYD